MAFSVLSCASAPKTDSAAPPSLTTSRKAAEDSRSKALLIKAEVAAKESFTLGETQYAAGKQLEEAGDSAKAQTSYDESAAAFKKAHEEATAKRELAVKSIKTAESERKLSEQALLDAETAKNEEAAAKKGEATR
jgi:hypothetical protein